MDSKNQIQKREIKFRAWDKELKILHPVQDLQFGNNGKTHVFLALGEDVCSEGFAPEKFDLMQLTGLKDKNGKEIFEGDILADNTSYYYTLIGWDLSGFKSKSVLKGGLNLNHSMPTFEFKNIIDYDDFARMKIVGNIYENPELLEAKND